jgi:2-oxoisovalerate dehydrogenase E1 component
MRELSYIEAAREALAEEMARDPSIFVVGEGIGPRGGNFSTTVGLYDLYGPERLRDTPISERGFTTMCVGAAAAGARPVVDCMFVDFALDALSDLVNQASKMRWMSGGRVEVPIIVRACMGIFSSGAAHHSGSYYSFFAHIPGFRVVLPATPRDVKGLLKTALRSRDPVIFLEHRALMALKGPVPEEEYLIPFGEAALAREGSDLTVVAISAMLPRCLEAARILEGEGISVEVIDPRTVAPLDMGQIGRSVAKTGRLLIVEEDYSPCSVAAEIAARVCDERFDDLDAPIRRLHCGFAPAPYSPALEKSLVIGVDSIVRSLRELRAE